MTSFKRAIELDPRNADARWEYSNFLGWLGRDPESLAEGREAQRLDPLSPLVGRNLARVHWRARRYDEAVAQYRRVIEMHPGFVPAQDESAGLLVDMGRYEESIAALRKRLESDDAEVPWIKAWLVRAYALSGRKAEALAMMSDLLRSSEASYFPMNYIAQAYAGLGDKDKAFEWLDKAMKAEDIVTDLKVAPWWDPLRPDPRFAGFLRRAGFTEESTP